MTFTHSWAKQKGQSLIEQAVAIRRPRRPDRLAHHTTQRRDAIDLEVAPHRQDSNRRASGSRPRGRIIDAEAERRCADQAP
jgi:hypothetical protein